MAKKRKKAAKRKSAKRKGAKRKGAKRKSATRPAKRKGARKKAPKRRRKKRKNLHAPSAKGPLMLVALDTVVCSACKQRTLNVYGELGKPGDLSFQYKCTSCGSTKPDANR